MFVSSRWWNLFATTSLYVALLGGTRTVDAAFGSSSSSNSLQALRVATIRETVTQFTVTSFSSSSSSSALQMSVAVSSSEMDDRLNLSQEERTVVNVVRKNGPSVAFVTSVWPFGDQTTGRQQQQQQQSRSRRQSTTSPTTSTSTSTSNLPRGQSLGSGSGFCIDRRGYIVTNFHVIERAYQIQEMAQTVDSIVDQITSNITALLSGPASSSSSYSGSESSLPFPQRLLINSLRNATQRPRPLPSVYVRINSATQYQKCKIVNVKPDLDVAVLKIMTTTTTTTTTTTEHMDTNKTTTTTSRPSADTESSNLNLVPMTFGSSSDLLVGQGLIAISNPFGLDNSVTTGVVSALNRELRTSNNPAIVAQPIRNCIQTDCAINPGNSGGPLLNYQGQVVGVNTAIITTSGSSAGIGFAVPTDSVQPVVEDMIRQEELFQATQSRKVGKLGLSIVKTDLPPFGTSSTTSSTKSSSSSSSLPPLLCQPRQQNWVASVQANSPAQQAGIRPIKIFEQDASVVYGDCIVAVGGTTVETYNDLRTALERCVPGEQLAITLQDGTTGERRVVYLTLDARE